MSVSYLDKAIRFIRSKKNISDFQILDYGQKFSKREFFWYGASFRFDNTKFIGVGFDPSEKIAATKSISELLERWLTHIHIRKKNLHYFSRGTAFHRTKEAAQGKAAKELIERRMLSKFLLASPDSFLIKTEHLSHRMLRGLWEPVPKDVDVIKTSIRFDDSAFTRIAARGVNPGLSRMQNLSRTNGNKAVTCVEILERKGVGIGANGFCFDPSPQKAFLSAFLEARRRFIVEENLSPRIYRPLTSLIVNKAPTDPKFEKNFRSNKVVLARRIIELEDVGYFAYEIDRSLPRVEEFSDDLFRSQLRIFPWLKDSKRYFKKCSQFFS